jgi:hypothetical protein
VSPSFLPGCLVVRETAVVCSRLFGAGFEGHGRVACVRVWLFGGGETAVVCSWLFGACLEGHGRVAFVPAWLFGGEGDGH